MIVAKTLVLIVYTGNAISADASDLDVEQPICKCYDDTLAESGWIILDVRAKKYGGTYFRRCESWHE